MLDQASGSSEQGAFYIQATGPSSRPRHTLKQGNTFAVCDSHGDIGASAGGPDGLFNNDTRFLSRLELLINGMQPLLLGSSIRDDNVSLSVDLTNPDIYRNGQIVLPRDTIHVVRTMYLWGDVAHQRIHVANHGDETVEFTLSLSFDCDFSDLFEARGTKRERRGVVKAPEFDGGRVKFSYEGLDHQPRSTVLCFDPVPDRTADATSTFVLSLESGQAKTLFFSAECHGLDSPKPETFFKGFIDANRAEKAATRNVATVETSNEIFNEVMCRSTADLYMLITETPQGPYPYAGTPWYSTTFGRDGIITALQMLWIDPSVTRGVLRRLAHYQATGFDAPSDAEPGKVLHEMRGGEMAALREVPFGLYYGTIDATPLFIVLAGQYLQRTGDVETIRDLWPSLKRALQWMDESGDRDGDGFLEYFRATDAGLQNQGWKDSFDSVFHSDGELAEGPIALVEVQGYAYAAKRMAAACAARLGFDQDSKDLNAQAASLAEKFEAQFWCEDIGTYAVALDGKKRPCRVRTSNAGQVLWTGIARADRAKRVADGLVSPSFFTGWGVRTVAQGEPRYNPMSYHNGSIWPHDNSLIALGMARYGLIDQAQKIFEGLFAAASYMDLRRLPELFCGFRRRRGAAPTLYPVACSPQAWAAGTPFLLLQATLGLEFDPSTRSIQFNNPQLPSFLDEVTIRNLGFGDAQVDVMLRRIGEHVALRVVKSVGSIQVTMLLS
ncbi:amylo-alpha-1,6-glucosidase [Lichenifustis flavocetrariae]|uniref:Amylo-alpha-1,6-glucosidase n=1 Tax=Lichenifustis flavocetrariae TaxID=2949735 RepID=A0AA42CI45_9HYPH|nr:amylo-alpha-1,6-glucosidase [Lichenifustis flavocetrariae]MCW6508208.1 amylo-alpha-1,6-glucosidase [Lichenifustis flavocetrariae]